MESTRRLLLLAALLACGWSLICPAQAQGGGVVGVPPRPNVHAQPGPGMRTTSPAVTPPRQFTGP